MATQQVNERLAAITAAGTSVWLDQIKRSLLNTGELRRLVEEDSLRGVTSNPTIFHQAILGSDDYDEQLAELAEAGLDNRGIYQGVAIRDIQDACDVLRPVYDATDGTDGFVSLEVDPDLAFDTGRTIEQAREYWERVDRPNLMIKIPGTTEGTPAIEEMIYEGRNINVTLLFGVEEYAAVAEAYIRGLERRLEEGKSVDIASVASFFVSRVDTEVDKRLQGTGHDELLGRAGIANARAAYQRFKQIFEGGRFAALRDAGARVQRPLWASTGVKNPAYSDVMYVEELLAPETVNTMPMATLLAAGDHAEVRGATADQDPSADLQALADAGIDMVDVTDQLLREGVEKFVEPMEELLAGIDLKREAVVTRRPPSIDAWIPDELEPRIAERVKRAAEEDVARRIWGKDDTLWGPAGQPQVADRLGWLSVTDAMEDQLPDLQAFADAVRDEGVADVVLLGMGGSSLAPEVIARSFGAQEGRPRLHVLDSTDAGAVRDVEAAIDLDRALFLVSTKSGGTIETLSLFEHFWSRRPEGEAFVAITDPGSGLEALGRERGFRRTFLNDPDIGGRYSALSYFGLVPAALMGADVAGMLRQAGVAQLNCQSFESGDVSSGLWLGLAWGELAAAGRDKLTYVIDPPLQSFGLWVEQLIAESTGKEGKGIVPVVDEPLGAPEDYGDDRTFVHLRHGDEPDEATDAKVAALHEAGHPVIVRQVDGPTDLGRLFFFAEFAIATAGWVLGINPFDQPNVQEAKDNTKRALDADARDQPDATDDDLRALLDGLGAPHYLAVMGYVAPSEDFDAAVAELRATVRDATKAATTFGYGPRFLHSTGQLHKGGPPTGRFLQLVHDSEPDVEVPGAPYTFTRLKHAQAIGDLETLRGHGLPAQRVTLRGDDPAAALRELTARLKGLL
ncbi:MAG: transaldolase / glucose-6-phosphate isomerase [Solirubrobacteraceae bacterium]|jgi:transaldolase/glucose-6-phosphate isomerase|nr:transaldolase / glucose-6-phosphate isomerase [Solirubrobacteraceae bacterium]